MNRVGIFSVINEKSTIEEYTFYFLEEIKKDVNKLIIILNQKVAVGVYNRLEKYGDILLYTKNDENEWKVKEDIERYHDYIKYANEIVFFNDSCYGPLYSLEEVWKVMELRYADFWGITGQKNNIYTAIGEIQYIHSYFLSVSHQLASSEEFKKFINWARQNDYLKSAIKYFEKNFYKYFSEKGYKGEIYINDEAIDLDEFERLDNLTFDSYRMVSKHHCPFVRRNALMNEHEKVLIANSGETAKKTLDYITKYTDYDESLIWLDLIHNYDIGQIRNAFHLDYVFQTKGKIIKRTEDCRVAVIAHINYTDLIEKCFSYIEKIPPYIDIFITTKGEKNIEYISSKIKKMDRKNIRIIVPKDRGREISALLVACKDFLMNYEYLCFVHDKKNNAGEPHRTVGQSFMDILWENTIKNDIYIENVLKKFDEEPRLGILAPPAPYMAMFFTTGANGWTTCFDETKKLAKRLKLECNMDLNNQPFVFGTTFWCRTDALKPLFESGIGYEDFCEEPMPVDGTISHAIERIFPYIAQSRGYYSGIMMTDEYASLYTCNCQYMLNTVLQKVLYDEGIEQYGDIHNLEYRIESFCSNYKKVYIYGAGLCGKACLSHLLKQKNTKMMGFVVSDGYRKQNHAQGFNIYEISEIMPKSDEGVLIAVHHNYVREIKDVLSKRGFINVGVYLEGTYEVV